MTNMIDCSVEYMQAQMELVRMLQEERNALPFDTIMSLTHTIIDHNDGHYTAWYQLCTHYKYI